jgi:hypothetical protein
VIRGYPSAVARAMMAALDRVMPARIRQVSGAKEQILTT